MNITFNSESRAAGALRGLVHTAGIADMYVRTLNRLFNAVLYNQDDMGMDDTEAITTLQALGLLRSDIQDIAEDRELKGVFAAGEQEVVEAVPAPVEVPVIPVDSDAPVPDIPAEDATAEDIPEPEAWRLTLDALKHGTDLLARRPKGDDSDHELDVAEILRDMADMCDRLESLTAWKEATDLYPDHRADRMRAFLCVANHKAVGLMELINDISDCMLTADLPSAEVSEILDAHEYAAKAARIVGKARERADERANAGEGADK